MGEQPRGEIWQALSADTSGVSPNSFRAGRMPPTVKVGQQETPNTNKTGRGYQACNSSKARAVSAHSRPLTPRQSSSPKQRYRQYRVPDGAVTSSDLRLCTPVTRLFGQEGYCDVPTDFPRFCRWRRHTIKVHLRRPGRLAPAYLVGSTRRNEESCTGRRRS